MFSFTDEERKNFFRENVVVVAILHTHTQTYTEEKKNNQKKERKITVHGADASTACLFFLLSFTFFQI